MLQGMDSFMEAFTRFTGGFHPVLVIVAAVLLAVALLDWLDRNGFKGVRPGLHKGHAYAAALATMLALIMVGVDAVSPYAADLNVPFPTSLLFYPTIGFVAEVAFHLVPLSVLILALRPLNERYGQAEMTTVAILAAALVEPLFQVGLAGSAVLPGWQVAYMAVHIYVLNVLQLWVFRRYDFASMLLFRLVYYLIWHVVWGYLRLLFLF